MSMKENIRYELVMLLGKPMLFTSDRVKKEDVPEGLIRYEIRHDDTGVPCEIKDSVFADYYGAVLAKEAISPRERDGVIQTTRDGIDFAYDDLLYIDIGYNIDQYLDQYDALHSLQKAVKDAFAKLPSITPALNLVKNMAEKQRCRERGEAQKKYRVAFSGFIYAEAESVDDAKAICRMGADSFPYTYYSQLEIGDVEEVDEFVMTFETEDSKEEEK